MLKSTVIRDLLLELGGPDDPRTKTGEVVRLLQERGVTTTPNEISQYKSKMRRKLEAGEPPAPPRRTPLRAEDAVAHDASHAAATRSNHDAAQPAATSSAHDAAHDAAHAAAAHDDAHEAAAHAAANRIARGDGKQAMSPEDVISLLTLVRKLGARTVMRLAEEMER